MISVKKLFAKSYITAPSIYYNMKEIEFANSLASEHTYKGLVIDNATYDYMQQTGQKLFGETVVVFNHPYIGASNLDIINWLNNQPTRQNVKYLLGLNAGQIKNSDWDSVKELLSEIHSLGVDESFLVAIRTSWLKKPSEIARFYSIMNIWPNLDPVLTLDITPKSLQTKEDPSKFIIEQIIDYANISAKSTSKNIYYSGVFVNDTRFMCNILEKGYSHYMVPLTVAKKWSVTLK